MKRHIQDLSARLLPLSIESRRHLHQYPELSYEEYKTAAYIKNILKEIGVEDIQDAGETGVTGIINKDSKGPVIALRADMDALPITEANNHPYKSKHPGIMHACGHDVHMASLLGAANILSQIRHHLAGKVLLVFQPGEEKLPGGAQQIIQSGIFENFFPELIIAQHVMPGMPTGHVGFRPGPYMASTDEIYITVRGKGGHAAVPSLTRDTVFVSAEIISHLKRHITAMAKELPCILSFGKLTANGATNVIPDEVKMEGTFRAMNEEFRANALESIRTEAEKLAEKHGTEAIVEIINGYPSLSNSKTYTPEAYKFASQFMPPENLSQLDIRMTGEDFAHYAKIMPIVFYRLGIAGNGLGTENVHNARFDVDEKCLETGIGLMAWLALSFLERFK